ncbi:ATPase [Tumebacillus avium]|uniref:ATPase n=1 Tax=Tumebacillus avium TaxID=1903704 RepID=A0A1Y0IHY1_9BACL|nr:SRPBCC family protein [Tumebacillus avium]ARU60111.1 ATPase [Tumebacillus avium]
MSDHPRHTRGEDVQVRVTRRFAVSPEQIFDAWLTPDLIGNWMFGPALREEEVLRIETDARVGGTFSFVVRRGGAEIDHIGQYLELDRPRRLAFTWSVAPDPIDSSRVRIEILPLESGCELTLTHELSPEWADYADRTKEAWSKMLDALASQLG